MQLKLPVLLTLALVSFIQATGQPPADPSYNITVKLENLQSDKGKVMIALYNSEETYMETRYQEALASISKDLKATAVLKNVPPGTYAISVFHDENNNDKLDLKVMKIPKEPYGFSNNARGTLGPATYQEASFKLKGDTTLTIELR